MILLCPHQDNSPRRSFTIAVAGDWQQEGTHCIFPLLGVQPDAYLKLKSTQHSKLHQLFPKCLWSLHLILHMLLEMKVIWKTDIPGMAASERLPTGLLAEVKKSSWQHNATFLSSSHKVKLTGKLKKYFKSDTGLHILFHYTDQIHETGTHILPHMWSGQDYKKKSEYSTTFFFSTRLQPPTTLHFNSNSGHV